MSLAIKDGKEKQKSIHLNLLPHKGAISRQLKALIFFSRMKDSFFHIAELAMLSLSRSVVSFKLKTLSATFPWKSLAS